MKRVILLYLLIMPLLLCLANAEDLVNDPNYKARCKVCHGANAEGKPQMKIPALKTRADRNEAELTKAIEETTKKRDNLAARMGNESYIAKAPPKLVEQTKEQLAAADAELVKLTEALKKLG